MKDLGLVYGALLLLVGLLMAWLATIYPFDRVSGGITMIAAAIMGLAVMYFATGLRRLSGGSRHLPHADGR